LGLSYVLTAVLRSDSGWGKTVFRRFGNLSLSQGIGLPRKIKLLFNPIIMRYLTERVVLLPTHFLGFLAAGDRQSSTIATT
jgi:hypothetical protein